MAFVTIPTNSIDVGDPLKKELFDLIKSNLDDLDTRVSSQESLQKRVALIEMDYSGAVPASTLTGLLHGVIPQNLIITDCYVKIYEKGSLGGELEIDIKTNSTQNDTGMVSIFTTKPKITLASASDYDKSTNEVFDATKTTQTAGRVFRLDVTELPTGGTLAKFMVYLYGEVS